MPESVVSRIRIPDEASTLLAEISCPELSAIEDRAGQQRWRNLLLDKVDGLRDVLVRAEAAIARCGSVLLQNVPVHREAIVVGISSYIGYVDPLGNGNPPGLVFDVAARKQADGTPSRGATYRGSGTSPLHTDSCNFSQPHSYVALACVRARPGTGGESMALDAAVVANDLAGRGLERMLALLCDPVFPFMSGWPRADDVVMGPVLQRADGRWHVRYAAQLLREGIEAVALDDDHALALAEFDAVAAELHRAAEFSLRPGDLWLLDNRRLLHGRRAFEADSGRLLKRCKLYPHE